MHYKELDNTTVLGRNKKVIYLECGVFWNAWMLCNGLGHVATLQREMTQFDGSGRHRRDVIYRVVSEVGLLEVAFLVTGNKNDFEKTLGFYSYRCGGWLTQLGRDEADTPGYYRLRHCQQPRHALYLATNLMSEYLLMCRKLSGLGHVMPCHILRTRAADYGYMDTHMQRHGWLTLTRVGDRAP